MILMIIYAAKYCKDKIEQKIIPLSYDKLVRVLPKAVKHGQFTFCKSSSTYIFI